MFFGRNNNQFYRHCNATIYFFKTSQRENGVLVIPFYMSLFWKVFRHNTILARLIYFWSLTTSIKTIS